MSRIVSFVVLLMIAITMGIICYKVMAGFILPLFMAGLTVVIFRPVYTWLLSKCNDRAPLAAGLTTLLIMLIVLVPIGWGVSLGIAEGFQLLNADDGLGMDDFLHAIRTRLSLEIPLSRTIKTDGVSPAPYGKTPNPLNLVSEALDQFPTEEQWKEIELIDDLGGDLQQTLSEHARTLACATKALDAALSTEYEQLRREQPNNKNKSHDDGQTPYTNKMAASFEQFKKLVKEVENVTLSSKGLFFRRKVIKSQAMKEKVMAADLTYRMFRRELLGGVPRCWAVELVNPDEVQMRQWKAKATDWLRRSIVPITGQTAAFVGNVVGWGFGLAIMLISIYYFLVDGPTMVKTVMRLSPLDDRYELELLSEFDKVSRAVVLATLVSAVAQGLLAGIAYFIAGFDAIFLLTILTTILALVPFVGAAAVWIPAALWLALVAKTPDGESGRIGYAIFMAVWGFAVVSMADNIIKPWVLHGQSKLHPLLTLLSVLGGVSALGPIGILVGPMVVAFLQALLNMLQKELHNFDTPMAVANAGTEKFLSGSRDGTRDSKEAAASKKKRDPVKQTGKGRHHRQDSRGSDD